MKRKLSNNIPFLASILAASLGALFLVPRKEGFSAYALVPLAVAIIALLRLRRVMRRALLEYENGPARFCAGKGIEIGSGGVHHVKGSMLVDIVNDFSSAAPYAVDYIADAHRLPKIESGSLDYVSASHVLEHLTNPIRAILEWMRILKPGGVLWLKVPDKRKTFDVKRERTALGHLIEDFEKDVPVDDPTHIDDQNTNSCPPRSVTHPYVHNHVWIPEDVVELFEYIGGQYAPLAIPHCAENACPNSQDFWILVRKAAAACPAKAERTTGRMPR